MVPLPVAPWQPPHCAAKSFPATLHRLGILFRSPAIAAALPAIGRQTRTARDSKHSENGSLMGYADHPDTTLGVPAL